MASRALQRTETRRFRELKSRIMIGLTYVALGVALIPLISILIETLRKGLPTMSVHFFTERIPPMGQPGGGIGPAFLGTLIVVGLASLIGVPIGLISGVHLAEYRESKLAVAARFLNDVFSNIPSIIVGVFGWALLVVVIGWSVLAGAFALAVMMIPIVSRTTEEAIKMVPNTLREASIALGVPRWKTTTSVVLRGAKKGIATGVLLAVARITGETAPLLLTILGSRFWFTGLTDPSAALPLAIFNFSQSPYSKVDWPRAWGASFILLMMVLGLNVIVRYLTREKY